MQIRIDSVRAIPTQIGFAFDVCYHSEIGKQKKRMTQQISTLIFYCRGVVLMALAVLLLPVAQAQQTVNVSSGAWQDIYYQIQGAGWYRRTKRRIRRMITMGNHICIEAHWKSSCLNKTCAPRDSLFLFWLIVRTMGPHICAMRPSR
jgi:hypothetical protein